MFQFINRIVNDYHEAKHLTIEAFAQLAVGGSKFAGKSLLKTYLFTIGKNLATRYIRQRGKAHHIPLEEIIDFLIDDRLTPDVCLEKDENRRLLHDAMKDLKNNHRVVLVLLYFEDMSYIQAGLAMNKSENQIRQLAHRAKISLKKKLESKGITSG